MALLTIGDLAPDFTARGADGKSLTLADLDGKFVLIYFYPKDMTPGCTAEACSINDLLQDFSESGATVIGVSSQDDDSHERFRNRHQLRFALASDPDRSIATSYGVGKMLGGLLPLNARVSFLVGPDRRIVEVWPHVNPGRHAAQVLEAVRRHRNFSVA